MGARPVVSIMEEQPIDLQSTRLTTMLSPDELHSMDDDQEYQMKYNDVTSKGSILSIHNNHEIEIDDSFTSYTGFKTRYKCTRQSS